MSKRSYKELEKGLIALKTISDEYSKKEYDHEFFDNMADMVDVIELIYDENNQPVDFYIRAINIAFAKFLGKTQKQLLNKRVSSVVNIIENHWLTSFASVDKTGKGIRFKSYGATYEKYYLVTAWKVSENRVGITFIDITKTEKSKIELKNSLEKEKKSTD
ncbi:MAG: hypothetical protein ACI9OE_002669 [Mariniflexile sp.]|jgi:hypothetical protein